MASIWLSRIALPDLADEVPPVEQQGRVFVAGADWDLVEVVVGLAPVGGRPFRVKVLDGAVFLLQELVELRFGFGIKGIVGVFVVELPADDVGVVAVALRHLGGDGAGKFTVLWC